MNITCGLYWLKANVSLCECMELYIATNNTICASGRGKKCHSENWFVEYMPSQAENWFVEYMPSQAITIRTSVNIKIVFQDMEAHMIQKRSSCLIHPGVRDKRRVSEIDLSQPRHETAFWWRHNEAVTSQLTDQIKWPNYPVELIGIHVHINTHKESLTQRCRRSTNVQLCLIFLCISIWFES